MQNIDKKYILKKIDTTIFKAIKNIAAEENIECYVIGGFVRDLLLGNPSKDIDIVVKGSGINLAQKVAKKLGGLRVSVFKNYGTAMFKFQNIEVEFVGARKESYNRNSRKPIVEDGTIDDDQKRRDFTINALAISLNKYNLGELIDPFNGIEDLQNGIIRTPLEPNTTFSDDPLRMLRAIRFASRLHFRIEDNTFEGIKANKERIDIVSKERIADELNKMIMIDVPSVAFKLLEVSGLLSIILPEMQALKGIEERNGIRHKDNFYHTIEVVDRIAPNTQNIWLRWAAVFHDIAKPVTKRFDNNIGWTFYSHNLVGKKMLPKIFERIKFPTNDKLKYVQKLVYLHMRPIVLSQDKVTDSAVRRLLFDAGDDIDDLMTLCEADITSKNEERVNKYMRNFKVVRRKLKEIEEKDKIRNFQPPVTGKDIMDTFNISPCKTIGDIKEQIKNAILDGKIKNNRDEAYQLMLEIGKQNGLKTASSNETK